MDEKQRKKEYLYRKYTELIEKIQKIRDEMLEEEVIHHCYNLWQIEHSLDLDIQHWNNNINRDKPNRRRRFANCDSDCEEEPDRVSPTF